MKKVLIIFLCLCLFWSGAACADTQEEQTGAVSAWGSTCAYADKLFDRTYVHQININLADEDWTELLADPTSKIKYPAQIEIDGETFNNVTFSTKGYSSLYFVAYGEEESRRYSFKVNFGKLTRLDELVVHLDVPCIRMFESFEPALHLRDGPSKGTCCLARLGHHRNI